MLSCHRTEFVKQRVAIVFTDYKPHFTRWRLEGNTVSIINYSKSRKKQTIYFKVSSNTPIYSLYIVIINIILVLENIIRTSINITTTSITITDFIVIKLFGICVMQKAIMDYGASQICKYLLSPSHLQLNSHLDSFSM